MSLYHTVINRLNSGNKRSVQAKKNILYSFVLRGSNIALGFLLVPLTLNYLNETKYGIWLTIASFIEWFSFLDIGLDNGFRNNFAEALAAKKDNLAKTYVSTVYAGMVLISVVMLACFFILNPFINWAAFFNAPTDMFFELRVLMIFVFSAFTIRFVLRIISTILVADQRPAMSSMFLLIGKILSLSVIYILTLTTEESLLYLGISFSIVPVFVLIFFSLFFFNGKYASYKPAIKFVDFSVLKRMLNLGAKFFVIQIAVLVIFSTDNMIITHLYTPKDVIPYNIAFKYFSIITLGFGIIVRPFWSAFTEAWVQEDIGWIKRIVKKLNDIWCVILVGTVILIIGSQYVYHIWVGDAVRVPFYLSIVMGVYVLARSYGSIYVNFLNGVGKVKLQFYTSIVSAIINIPLSVFFAKYCGMGVAGVMVATIVSISFGFLIAPYQYKMVISKRAVGIWNQ